MRASTRRCRSLAAWYSAFSRRSPSSRARLISRRQLGLQLLVELMDFVLEFLQDPLLHDGHGSRNGMLNNRSGWSGSRAARTRSSSASASSRARRGSDGVGRRGPARRRAPRAGSARDAASPIDVAAFAERAPRPTRSSPIARSRTTSARAAAASSPSPIRCSPRSARWIIRRASSRSRVRNRPHGGRIFCRVARKPCRWGQTPIRPRSGPLDPLVLIWPACRTPATSARSSATAAACGATGVVAIDGSANPFGWKALRGAMGGTFRLPVAARGTLADVVRVARLSSACGSSPPCRAAARRCRSWTSARRPRSSSAAKVPAWPTRRSMAAARARDHSDAAAGRVAQRRGRRRADPLRGDAAAPAGGSPDGSVRRRHRPPRRADRSARRRSPSGCGRAPSTSSSARRSCWRPAGRCARRSSAICCSRSSSGARPGTGKTTLARIIADDDAGALRRRSAPCSPGIKEIRDVMAEAEQAAPPTGPPHDRLHRRDPPLQQGAAGRVPAARRSRRHRAHRRDDREPVVRGQRGAAVAVEGLRAAAARRPTRSSAILRRALADRRARPRRASRSTSTDDALARDRALRERRRARRR